MQKAVSFLRGVNMTGHNMIRMAELSDLYRKIGFKDAETYIQSGNVVFSLNDNSDIQSIASEIEGAIFKRFKYTIPVLIRTAGEIKKIISANPFQKDNDFDPVKLAVIFLYDDPMDDQTEKVRTIDYPPDKFKIIGKEIFIYCPNGFGRTKLYTNFFEKKMKVTGTARNWKTINTILSIAEEIH
ncbi:MAG: DUF1697 domain-containing protein [Bacteroidia bacterium]|nr:DUF1697 domain-containing protein [Bacteroidia bacterium]